MSTTTQPRLSPIVENRYSPRSFASTALPEGYLELLLEAARRAPSGGNSQPWRFIYAEKANHPEAFVKMADCLMGNNQLWAPQAPLLLCVVAQEVNAEGKPIGSAKYDCGAAMAWLTVQASELGLYVHQMGGFEREKARQELHIPEGFAPVVMAAVGYLGHPDALPEHLKPGELKRTGRHPIEHIAFIGSFATQTA